MIIYTLQCYCYYSLQDEDQLLIRKKMLDLAKNPKDTMSYIKKQLVNGKTAKSLQRTMVASLLSYVKAIEARLPPPHSQTNVRIALLCM